jgi:hypothetical protein
MLKSVRQPTECQSASTSLRRGHQRTTSLNAIVTGKLDTELVTCIGSPHFAATLVEDWRMAPDTMNVGSSWLCCSGDYARSCRLSHHKSSNHAWCHKTLIKTDFFEFLRRNIHPLALPILKHKIITTNQAVNITDDNTFYNSARLAAADFLINELTRVFTGFVLVIVSFILSIRVEPDSVQISNSYVDYTMTICCLRHPSRHPPDDT